MAKSQILFACSEEFKQALGEFASRNNVSLSLVIREAVAQYIKYDLAGEVVVDGRRKYDNVEERKKAQNEEKRKARIATAKLVAAYEQDQRRFDALLIEESLKRKGINLEE